MASSYPGSLDSFTTKSGSDGLNSPDHAGAHNDLQDSIEAIQGELGTDPAGAAATVAARIAATETVANAAQPADSDLTAIAALTTTSFGRGLLELANAGALRTAINVEDGADVTDAANVEAALEAATLTGVTGATGDEFLIIDATDGGLKAVAYDDLPGAGGGLSNIVEDITPQLGGDLDLNGNVITGLEIGTDVQAHSAVLDATTASFTTADESKLDGIAAGAEVNTVDSVNSATGTVVLDADDIDDTSTTNKFATAAQLAKVDTLSTAALNTVAVSGSAETLALGVNDVTMDESCTFTFPTVGSGRHEFTLILRGAFTPTFPASVDWPSATPPTYATPTEFSFATVDSGTTWLGVAAPGFG